MLQGNHEIDKAEKMTKKIHMVQKTRNTKKWFKILYYNIKIRLFVKSVDIKVWQWNDAQTQESKNEDKDEVEEGKKIAMIIRTLLCD